jgi:hypothetical protein
MTSGAAAQPISSVLEFFYSPTSHAPHQPVFVREDTGRAGPTVIDTLAVVLEKARRTHGRLSSSFLVHRHQERKVDNAARRAQKRGIYTLPSFSQEHASAWFEFRIALSPALLPSFIASHS